MRLSRLLISFLIVVLLILVEWRFLEPWGVPLQLPLAAILALSLLIDARSVVLLSLSSFFLLNWRPGVTPEFAAYLAVPLFLSLFQRFFPLRSTLNAALVGCAGVLLWYLAANPSGVFAFPSRIGLEAILCSVVAALVFRFFRWAEQPSLSRR